MIEQVGNAADEFGWLNFVACMAPNGRLSWILERQGRFTLRRQLTTNSNARVAVVPKVDVEIYWPLQIVFVSLHCARILRDAFGLRRVILGIFMPEGTIKKLADKGFGFIQGADSDIFFHFSALEGVSFEELREGQKVQYQEGTGPKGPRAENVTLIEG